MPNPWGNRETWADEEDDPTIPCPFCDADVFDETQRCPNCGNYLTDEDLSSAKKPWWILVGVVLCLVVILIWIF